MVRVLMLLAYEGNPICIRMIGKNMFMWDVVINGRFYSSYMIINPSGKKQKLDTDEINEVAKMCYAGAAATVDLAMSKKLSQTDEGVVKLFEGARKQLEGKS